MLKCELPSKYHIDKARTKLAECPNLSDYKVFANWWVKDVDASYRTLLLALAGIENNGFSSTVRDDYTSLYYVVERKGENVVIFKDIDKKEKMALHRLHGRLLESQEYTVIELLFSYEMTSMLFKYLARFGFKDPINVLRLYEVGGFSDRLKQQAEIALSSKIVEEVIPADTEVRFGSAIDEMLDFVPKEKWQYIRLPNCIDVPDCIKVKLGRKVVSTYNGDLSTVVEAMHDSGKYSDDDIEFLYDYINDIKDSMVSGRLSRDRKIKLIGDLKLRM